MNTESISLLLSFATLLAIPCGIVLCAAAVRRGMLNKGWPPTRDLLQSCAIATTITLAITMVICLVFKWTGLFDAHFYRPSSRDYGRVAKLGLNPKEVTFASADGTRLHGWFLSADNAVGTVISLHGSDRNITDTVKNSYWLTAYGLNLFVFDYRGYGRSEGVPSRQGLIDDSIAAIECVVGLEDLHQGPIALFGQSMGGQLAINAAAALNAPEVQLVISEASYARHSYHISDKLGRLGPLWLFKWGAWLLTSDDLSGEHAIAKLNSIPVLLIHGSSDSGVSPYHSERMFAAASEPKDIWRFDGLGHLQIFATEQNQRRLADYIKQKLGNQPKSLPNSTLGDEQEDASK